MVEKCYADYAWEQTAALLASFPGRVWAEEENAAALAVFSPVVMPE